MSTSRAAIVSAFIVVFLAYAWLARSNKRRKLPPGPKGYPLIGDIINRPTKYEWKVYAEWGRVYDSPIVATRLLHQSIVILNTAEAVNDLLEKRSAVYSDRPALTSFEMMGLGEWDVALFPYNSFWRACRRLLHQELHSAAVTRYHTHEMKTTHEFLHDLLAKPDEFVKHIKHMAGSAIISVAYGIDVEKDNDPYVALAESQVEGSSMTVSPGFLVDLIPIMRHIPSWFPGGGFKNILQYYKEKGRAMMDLPLAEARARIDANTHTPSFVSLSLARRAEEVASGTYKDNGDLDGRFQENEDQVWFEKALKASSSVLHAAGSDTTTSTITTAILGLISSPFALQQAQAQIDALLRGTRLPTFENRDELTWVSAIVMESLRWQVVAPVGVPRYTKVEDEYKGYTIPAGSIILPNTWAILQDPKMYPSPHLFKPERFLHEDGTIRKDVKDPASAAFGYGRRICPGRFMAQDSIWIAVACMVASFDFRKKKDENGQTVEPSYAMSTGAVSYPEPFECEIVPRSEDARILIQNTSKEGSY